MQSVTRKRWLAVKIGWMLLAAAVWGGVISALVTWWSGPNNAQQLNAFDPGRFDIMGIVPVAYSLFAMALGIAAGALLRRTLPAMAVTLAGFIAVRALIALLAPSALHERGHRVLQGDSAASRRRRPPGSSRRASSARTARPPAQPNGTALDGVPTSYLPASCAAPPRALVTLPASCSQALAHFHGVPHLPARRPLLDVPGHRDRHLPRPRRRPHRGHRGVAAPPRRLDRGVAAGGGGVPAACIWPVRKKISCPRQAGGAP